MRSILLAMALLFAASAFADGHPARVSWRGRPFLWFRDVDRSRPSARDLRGIVESVNERRNTFVIREDETGDFITVVRRDRRVMPQPGDVVSISGPWNRRNGWLEGYSIQLID